MSIQKDDLVLLQMPDYSRTTYNANIEFQIQKFDTEKGKWESITDITQKKIEVGKSGKSFLLGRPIISDVDEKIYWKQRMESYWSHRDIAIEAAKLARTKTINSVRVIEYADWDMPIKVIWKNGKWSDE